MERCGRGARRGLRARAVAAQGAAPLAPGVAWPPACQRTSAQHRAAPHRLTSRQALTCRPAQGARPPTRPSLPPNPQRLMNAWSAEERAALLRPAEAARALTSHGGLFFSLLDQEWQRCAQQDRWGRAGGKGPARCPHGRHFAGSNTFYVLQGASRTPTHAFVPCPAKGADPRGLRCAGGVLPPAGLRCLPEAPTCCSWGDSFLEGEKARRLAKLADIRCEARRRAADV